jgi:hypothetical protein
VLGSGACRRTQVALVAIELESLKLARRHRAVGLAASSDRGYVPGARRSDTLLYPHLHQLAVSALAIETVFVDREDFGAVTALRPARQLVPRYVLVLAVEAPIADEVYRQGFLCGACVAKR